MSIETAPTSGGRVIVYDAALGLVTVAYWCHEKLRWVSTETEDQGLANLTHWQPLPDDPGLDEHQTDGH